jgi:hypothetical protein
MFIARSLVFYPGFYEDNCQELSDEIIIPSFHLNNLMERFDDNETLYIDMINSDTNQSVLVTIGTPHNYDKNTIFAPQWILDQIGCTGNCDSVIKIQKADMTQVPIANKITIKPLDPIAFELDTLKCFETAFMNLHSIKEGITIQIPVPDLGKDYVMFAHIEKVDPSPVSRIVQGEVDVEFINEFKEIPNSPATILGSNIDNTAVISNSMNTIVTPILTPTECPTLTAAEKEERRKRIRESWVNRFNQNSC